MRKICDTLVYCTILERDVLHHIRTSGGNMRASAFKIFILALGLLFLATSCLLTREDLYDKFGEDPTQQGTTSPTPGISVDIGDGLITKEGPVTPGSDSFTMVLDTQPTATVTIGAFLTVDDDPVTAAATALAFFGLAGEEAARTVSAPGSYMIALLDTLYTITPEHLKNGSRLEG